MIGTANFDYATGSGGIFFRLTMIDEHYALAKVILDKSDPY